MDSNTEQCDNSKRMTPEDGWHMVAGLLDPNKRNASVAISLGVVLLLIQIVRAGYMPDFDWSSGVSMAALVAVLALSLFTMAILVLMLATPALLSGLAREPDTQEQRNEVRRARSKYLAAIVLYVIVIGIVEFAPIYVAKWFPVINGIPGKWVIAGVLCALFLPLLALSAVVVPPTGGGTWLRRVFARWENYLRVGGALAYVFIVNCALAAVFSDLGADSFDSQILRYIIVLVLLVSVNWLFLFLPKSRYAYLIVSTIVFVVFCIPSAKAAFTALGLGNRNVEFVVVDMNCLHELERAGIVSEKVSATLFRCKAWMRLRFGTEIVLSKIPGGWGNAVDVVTIPRDAIRGLRFVPPPTKDDSKPSAEEARNPKHLMAASKQWALRRAAEQFLAYRAERWKAAQKNELSAAQAEWLKWARETTAHMAQFADGYPVLPEDKQQTSKSAGVGESAKAGGDSAAASAKP